MPLLARVAPDAPGELLADLRAHLRGPLSQLAAHCDAVALYALAARRTYLHCTDHLSDSELYVWLHDFLDDPAPDVPPAWVTP